MVTEYTTVTLAQSGGATGRELDLQPIGRGFKSYSGQCCVTSCSHRCASVTKQYNLVPARGRWCCAAGKVTAGLAESSLPPGGWLTVTCRLTACTPGSALGPMLGIEYGKPLPFYLWAGGMTVCCVELCRDVRRALRTGSLDTSTFLLELSSASFSLR